MTWNSLKFKKNIVGINLCLFFLKWRSISFIKVAKKSMNPPHVWILGFCSWGKTAPRQLRSRPQSVRPGKQKSMSVRLMESLTGSQAPPGWRQAGQAPASCSPELAGRWSPGPSCCPSKPRGAGWQSAWKAEAPPGKGPMGNLANAGQQSQAGRDGAEQGAWGWSQACSCRTTRWPNKLGIWINMLPESWSLGFLGEVTKYFS